MSKFKVVGERFSISLFKTTFGPVVASRDAFFLIPASNEFLAASLMHVAPVPLPAGTTGWNSNSGTQSAFKVQLESLVKVTSHPDWPVSNITTGPIFAIPRHSITAFKYRWYGAITLQTSERRFVITPDAGFFPKGTKQFLQEHGWLL
ncbi:MAG: hypothetical protein AAF456_21765 [Planctomycetota bacterium]